jgi:hypothetical protein
MIWHAVRRFIIFISIKIAITTEINFTIDILKMLLIYEQMYCHGSWAWNGGSCRLACARLSLDRDFETPSPLDCLRHVSQRWRLRSLERNKKLNEECQAYKSVKLSLDWIGVQLGWVYLQPSAHVCSASSVQCSAEAIVKSWRGTYYCQSVFS